MVKVLRYLTFSVHRYKQTNNCPRFISLVIYISHVLFSALNHAKKIKITKECYDSYFGICVLIEMIVGFVILENN
jgi:hypothetical protein